MPPLFKDSILSGAPPVPVPFVKKVSAIASWGISARAFARLRLTRSPHWSTLASGALMLKMLEGLIGSGICHRVVWSNVCVVQWYERMFLLDLKLMWSTRATRHFLPVNDGKTALSRLCRRFRS